MTIQMTDTTTVALAAMTPEVRETVVRIMSSVGDDGVSLPREAYTSEAFYEFEKEALFARTWLYMCHVSEVPDHGSIKAVTVGDEPLLVTNNKGTINVVSAVCQHRGYAIAAEDGNANYLRCPYHYWTYGLDGRLMGAPSMTPKHDLDQLKATACLPKLKVEIWEGLVFANMDPNAASLIPTLEKLTPHVQGYRIADLTVVHELVLADLPFNWKNMQENALEEYHTTYVHKGWHENAPAHLVKHPEYENGDGMVFRHAYLVEKAGVPIPGFPNMPIIPNLPEEMKDYMLFFAVPPLNFAAVEAFGIKMFRITPQSAGRTTLTITWMYPQETVDSPDWPELWEGQLDLINKIDYPDLESNTNMFKGLKSRFAPQGPLSHYERTLPQFNEWMLERYLTPLGQPV